MNVSKEKMLESLVNDPYELCKILFKNDSGKPLELYDYQIEIVSNIFYSTHKRTLCWATTRAGKSLGVAIGTILRAIFTKGERIPVIAPTGEHTKIIMNYVIQHVLDTKLVMDMLAITTKGKTHERLRAELSKKRITFKNNSEIRVLSADIMRDGRALVGFGGNTIIVDETEQIPEEIIRSKLMRMLGDSPDASVFMISNPVKKGFMFEARKNPKWHQININWQDCVRVGRLTREFVEEQRADLSPIEFTMWYDSLYPQDLEDTLIRWEWIERAMNCEPSEGKGSVLFGLDVAELGRDLSVIIKATKIDDFYRVDEVNSWGKKDTMQTVGKVIQLIDIKDPINIDSTGVGKGVFDRLAELNYNANEIKGGRSPTSKHTKVRFSCLKDELYWSLREMFEEGRISIPKHAKLISELNKLTYEITSSGKIKVIKPKDKSPDFADSLSLIADQRLDSSLVVFLD